MPPGLPTADRAATSTNERNDCVRLDRRAAPHLVGRPETRLDRRMMAPEMGRIVIDGETYTALPSCDALETWAFHHQLDITYPETPGWATAAGNSYAFAAYWPGTSTKAVS